MTDKVSKEKRSGNMRAIHSKNTKPEIEIRRLVHEMGFRYCLHYRKLPGNPDLTFVGKRKVIFVHGCFWHQHNNLNCVDSRVPKSNTRFWLKKFKGNIKRDKQNYKDLRSLGWKFKVLWECQLKNKKSLERGIKSFLSKK